MSFLIASVQRHPPYLKVKKSGCQIWLYIFEFTSSFYTTLDIHITFRKLTQKTHACHFKPLSNVIPNSSHLQALPYPKGQENWLPEGAIFASFYIKLGICNFGKLTKNREDYPFCKQPWRAQDKEASLSFDILNYCHFKQLSSTGPKVAIFASAFEYFIVLGIYNFGKLT